MMRASSHAHKVAIVSDSTRATTMFPPLPCESANPKTVDVEAVRIERRRVRAQREEHRVAERQLADVTEEQVEAAREEREDHHRGRDPDEAAPLSGEGVCAGDLRQQRKEQRRPQQRMRQHPPRALRNLTRTDLRRRRVRAGAPAG
jgi:hypothetical protein